MKRNTIYVMLSVVAMLSMLLSACGAAATTAAPAPATAALPLQHPLLQPCHCSTATAAPATAAAPATQAPAAATSIPTAATQTGRVYAFVPKNLGNPYFDAANSGAQLAAAELGVKVLYQGQRPQMPLRRSLCLTLSSPRKSTAWRFRLTMQMPWFRPARLPLQLEFQLCASTRLFLLAVV